MSLMKSEAALVPHVNSGAELCLKGGRSLDSGEVFLSGQGEGSGFEDVVLGEKVDGMVDDEVVVPVALERS
jgi:hypothetical protein